jgi:HlyD family secretion protein
MRTHYILPLFVIAACRAESVPDAFGNFEANEVTVSAQTAGQLLTFVPTEGVHVDRGAVVGLVDTTQLALERSQIIAQRQATASRGNEVTDQITVLEVQRDVARRTYERTKRLVDQKAATAQQLDQAERDYKTLTAQIEAAQAQRTTVGRDVAATQARVAQIADRIGRSRVINPEPGTVLATFVRAGEMVQAGQPLYKIANLDTLTLRAYIVESQLSSVKLGQTVQVHIDQGNGQTIALPGKVSWIASKAEFTPTPIQTRDERTGLSYAIKVLVANQRGALKIGMPADVDL